MYRRKSTKKVNLIWKVFPGWYESQPKCREQSQPRSQPKLWYDSQQECINESQPNKSTESVSWLIWKSTWMYKRSQPNKSTRRYFKADMEVNQNVKRKVNQTSQPKVSPGWYESQLESIKEVNQISQPESISKLIWKSTRMFRGKSTKLKP